MRSYLTLSTAVVPGLLLAADNKPAVEAPGAQMFA